MLCARDASSLNHRTDFVIRCRSVAVALFHEDDDPVNQLAYNVSAKTINILDTVLPNNKIVQKTEFVMHDTFNVTRVGKNNINKITQMGFCFWILTQKLYRISISVP